MVAQRRMLVPRPLPRAFEHLPEQPVEHRPVLRPHLQRDAQRAMHLGTVEQVHERQRSRGVDLVAESDPHAFVPQRAGELRQLYPDAMAVHRPELNSTLRCLRY
jgi:hypothetical protein